MGMNKSMSVIAEEDTVTGFLLGGVGELDKERNTNFLVNIYFSNYSYTYYCPDC